MENEFFSIPEWIIIMPYWLVEKYSIFPTIDDKNKIVAGIMGKKKHVSTTILVPKLTQSNDP